MFYHWLGADAEAAEAALLDYMPAPDLRHLPEDIDE